jgi:uncharacterized membrane-anchored protein
MNSAELFAALGIGATIGGLVALLFVLVMIRYRSRRYRPGVCK